MEAAGFIWFTDFVGLAFMVLALGGFIFLSYFPAFRSWEFSYKKPRFLLFLKDCKIWPHWTTVRCGESRTAAVPLDRVPISNSPHSCPDWLHSDAAGLVSLGIWAFSLWFRASSNEATTLLFILACFPFQELICVFDETILWQVKPKSAWLRVLTKKTTFVECLFCQPLFLLFSSDPLL